MECYQLISANIFHHLKEVSMKTKVLMSVKSLFSIPLLLFLIQFLFVANAQTLNQKTSTELDSFFKKIIEEQKYVGLGACIIKDNRVFWNGCYGYSDLEKKTPLNSENIFPLMSLSKTVTAFALLMLYEEGLFQLDEDINKYLPIEVKNPNYPHISITFRMLLNHTAGFEDVMPTGLRIPENVGRPPSSIGDSKITLDEYIKDLLTPEGRYYSTEYFSLGEPGKKYSYSNIGYSLIGYLVEKIANQDFSDFCKEKIFDPLEMRNTSWHLRDLDTAKVIFAYNFSPEDTIPNYKKVQHFGEPGYPAGMMRTTFDDFTNFIVMLLNEGRFRDNQLVRRETIDVLLAPQNMKNIPSRSHKVIDRSLAWLIIEDADSEFYTMNGFSGSMFAAAYFSKTGKTGIIYYFTGINMKNMNAIPVISNRLLRLL